jgi:hypothetical protein
MSTVFIRAPALLSAPKRSLFLNGDLFTGERLAATHVDCYERSLVKSLSAEKRCV